MTQADKPKPVNTNEIREFAYTVPNRCEWLFAIASELDAARTERNIERAARLKAEAAKVEMALHLDKVTDLAAREVMRAQTLAAGLAGLREAVTTAEWCGRVVMEALEEHGPSIVPHLIDTDDNAGQRFRNSLDRLAAAMRGEGE